MESSDSNLGRRMAKKESIASYDTSNRELTSSQRKGKFSEINFVSLVYLGRHNEATETD